MMIRKHVLISLAIAIFPCLMSNWCIAEDAEFDLGVLACLSGECAEWGHNTVKGIRLAVKEINQTGGILNRKVRIRVQDTVEAGRGAGAVTAFQNLRTMRNIKYFIGPTWTPGGLALAPIVGKAKGIIMISPSLGVRDFNETAGNIFNIWPHDEIGTRALARYAKRQGWNKAAVFSSQQPFEQAQGEFFVEEFKELGGEIGIKLEPLPSLSNLKPEALRVVSLNPDVVFLSNTNRLGLAAKELRRLNYKGPFLAVLLDRTRLEDASGALENAVTARYPEASKRFVEEFVTAYSEKPGIAADTAYDAVYVYVKAITKAKTFDTAEVKKALFSIRHDGASGIVEFDSLGAVKKKPRFFKAKGLELIEIIHKDG